MHPLIRFRILTADAAHCWALLGLATAHVCGCRDGGTLAALHEVVEYTDRKRFALRKGVAG